MRKIGVVAAGYVVAVAVAFAVVSVYVAATSGPDRQTYAAMYDFGDMLLWLAVFGVAALPATGAALFFLRPYSLFWRASSTGARVLAATAVVTLFACVAPGMFGSWSALAPLRVFLAPLFSFFFRRCSLLRVPSSEPSRSPPPSRRRCSCLCSSRGFTCRVLRSTRRSFISRVVAGREPC